MGCTIFELQFLVSVPGSGDTWDLRVIRGGLKNTVC